VLRRFEDSYTPLAPATVVLLFQLGFVAPAASEPAPRPAPETASTIREAVEALRGGTPVQVGTLTLASSDVLPRLYESRGYAPLWTSAESTRQMVAAAAASYGEGLNPEDYHYSALSSWVGETGEVLTTDPRERATVDLVLTDALILLGRHLKYGKVDPAAIDAAWDFLATEREAAKDDAVAWANAAIEGGAVRDLLARNRPAITGYDVLQKELARLRELESAGGWGAVPVGPTLRPGERDPRVLALRARLEASGTPVGSDTTTDTILYDPALTEAVREFQRAHGLEPDGVTGPKTVEALARTPRQWIDQIRVNLERARWIRSGFENALVVDIAGFDARYVRDGQLKWQARVQVGNKYRSTPVLRSSIRSLVLNPTWTVPPTILAEDILPEAARDPLYLGGRGIQVYDREGQAVDPLTVDWGSFTASTLPYTLRQGPGPGNPLGRIKFLFPNPHFVYLHDTPSRSLFSRADRAASSGCIRIERPIELAELLLQQKKGWSRERLDAAIASGRTQTLFLDEPVPIYLLYWTVGVREDGSVLFKRDVYDRDPPVLAALDSGLVVEDAKQLTRQMP
jgi:murein L,D-transpeptidase YcbB/YkuD